MSPIPIACPCNIARTGCGVLLPRSVGCAIITRRSLRPKIERGAGLLPSARGRFRQRYARLLDAKYESFIKSPDLMDDPNLGSIYWTRSGSTPMSVLGHTL